MLTFTLKSKRAHLLSPELAMEIGLHESIVLLQIAYWVNRNGKVLEGRRWTRQSGRNLRDMFPFLSRSTVHRAINSLVKLKLLWKTKKFNKWDKDKTHWYALREEGLAKLESIKVLRVKNRVPVLSEPSRVPDDTAIPKSSNNIYSYNINLKTHAGVESHDEELEQDLRDLEYWAEPLKHLDPQPVLSPVFLPRPKALAAPEPIPTALHNALYRLCFRAETLEELKLLTSAQRGRVADLLGELREAGADFNLLHLFEAWWVMNWRSKDRATQQYQPPRPEQVREHWLEAMRSGVKPKPVVENNHKPVEDKSAELALLMTRRRNERAN